MQYYLYILKSLKDNNLYIGISQNVEERLKQHNSGKTFSTKGRRPFILIYTETHKTRDEARQRQKFLKSYTGAEKKRKIVG